MPLELLIEAAAALYGAQWQSALADGLGVADRTVRRWVAGQPIPEGVRADLLRLVKERRGELAAVEKRLR